MTDSYSAQAVAILRSLRCSPLRALAARPSRRGVGADRHHRQSRRHRHGRAGRRAARRDRHRRAHADRHRVRDCHRRRGPLRHPERPRRRLRRSTREHERVQEAEQERPRGRASASSETVDFKLQLAAVTETVEVVGQTPIIDSSRAGTADNISNAVKESLPTISRSITDIARISPLFNSRSAPTTTRSAVSVAGRNNRYNNLQIDGAVNNDVFGLAAIAARPAARRKRSRSASTRSRKSSWSSRRTTCVRAASRAAASTPSPRAARTALHGTAFYFGRNQDWVGEGADRHADLPSSRTSRAAAASADRSSQNKAFFFGNVDYGAASDADRASRSTAAASSSAARRKSNRVLNILQNKYGYDPGPDRRRVQPDDQQRQGTSSAPTSTSARDHQLTVRHNYINALNDIGFPSRSTLRHAGRVLPIQRARRTRRSGS